MPQHARPPKEATDDRGSHAVHESEHVDEQAKRIVLPNRERRTSTITATICGLAAVACIFIVAALWRQPDAVRPDTSEIPQTVAPSAETLQDKAFDQPALAEDEPMADTPPEEEAPGTDTPIDDRLAACEPYAPTSADIAALSGQTEPFAFCLNPESPDAAPSLSDETVAALAAACAPLADSGWSIGYLLIDLGTGRGLAANLDARAYGASSFKAPYALYLCETQLDTQQATADTPCFEGTAAAFMDPEGTYLHDGAPSYPLGMLIEDSVTKSDNDSYRILRASYDSAGFHDWLSSRGFPATLADDWFPTYSAREAGLLWLHVAEYLSSEASSTHWLDALLGQTETSFVRNALGGDVAVRDKAGWYADDDPSYCGISDGAVVTSGGRDYLLCLMSDAPYSADNAETMEKVVATAFDARNDLG